MAFVAQTFTAGQVLTASQMNQMDSNIDATVSKLFLSLLSYFAILTESATSYQSKLLGRVYIPAKFSQVRWGGYFRANGVNTAFAKLKIDTLEVEISSNDPSYTAFNTTLDISSLTGDAWYDLEILLQAGTSTPAEIKGITVVADVEGDIS